MTANTPAAEIEIDETLVRRLLESQMPELAERPIRAIDHGWDNAMFRLGEDLSVRLPRREVAANLVRNEQAALPSIAPALQIAIPSPLHVGEPSPEYPWAWSVLPWFDGQTADLTPPAEDQAEVFADFLQALHRVPNPQNAPLNDVRGVPLVERQTVIEERLDRLRSATDRITPTIDAVWRDALAEPPTSMDVWLHGDLHTRNILVEDERLSAIIDWGDVTSGDAACDLAGIWMLFESTEARAVAAARYGMDDSLRARSLGSAVGFAAVLLDTGLTDDPRHAAIGDATFRRIETDAR